MTRAVAMPSRSNWRDVAILLGLVALAIALRLFDLTGESLWFDEAYSVWTSSMDIASLRVLWDWQIEFPLYYLLLHYWMGACGQGEFSVRAFGALAGAITVVPLYLWGRALFGWRVASVAALLLAANPYHIWYSQEVRMYAWALLFTVASLYAFWRLAQGGGRGWWVCHALLTGLTFHLHYYIGWIVLAESLFIILRSWRAHGGLFRLNAWYELRWWCLDQLAVLALAMPAFAVFLTKLLTLDQWGWLAERYGPPGLAQIVGLLSAYTVGVAFPGPATLRWIVLALFLALAGWGALRTSQSWGGTQRSEALFLAFLTLGLPLALVFALGQFTSVWVPRYLLLFIPSFLLLVALGVDALEPNLAIGAVALLLGVSLYALSGMYGAQQKEDWRGAAAHLSANAGHDDLIVLMDQDCRVPFDCYYGDRSLRIQVSRFADDAMLDETIDEILRKQRGGHLWLVVSHASSDLLERRLNALPELRPMESPDFVGVRLVAYAWS